MIGASDTILLAQLPSYVFTFVLLLARVGAACMLLPAVGEADLPVTVRLAFALAFSALLLPARADGSLLMPDAPWRAAEMVMAELVTGLTLGWMAQLVVTALQMAGQFIANLTGLSNVLHPDGDMGAQASVVSRLLGLAAPALLLASGLQSLPLSALAGSYDLVPIGALIPAADTTALAFDAVTRSFALAAQLSGPFILANIIWQVALGVLGRLVPQLQVYFVAMPGQILGGLALFAWVAAGLMSGWLASAADRFAALPGL